MKKRKKVEVIAKIVIKKAWIKLRKKMLPLPWMSSNKCAEYVFELNII